MTASLPNFSTPNTSINSDSQSPKAKTLTLRPYQTALINDLYLAMNQGYKRIAIIAGTGAGKTVIGGQICAHAEAKGCWLLFVVHLDVLVGQTYEKMKSFGLRCGFIKAGWPEDPEAPIQIGSIQTMAKRGWWRKWPANIVFYDEAHTTAFSQVGQEILYRSHPGAVMDAIQPLPWPSFKEVSGWFQRGGISPILVRSIAPENFIEVCNYKAKIYINCTINFWHILNHIKTSLTSKYIK